MNSIPKPKGIKIEAFAYKIGEGLPQVSFECVQNVIATEGRDIKMSNDWMFCTQEGLQAQADMMIESNKEDDFKGTIFYYVVDDTKYTIY